MTLYDYETLVIGSGAAGYNAACRLKQFGKQVAIITENVNFGTSRNTGSDKQTYYKLGLGGNNADSVRNMAENLFSCGSVDGDNALCEAALSTRCFMNLCELGVKFPVNRYGEYVGYKTDHDPYARATSAGPLTSKFMTEALQNNAKALGIEVISGFLAVKIVKYKNSVCGLICIKIETGDVVTFRCNNIIIATGGPAGIYADSVYPQCHIGMTGLAISAGAKVQNMTEWQYGLASINPRWNVSGTYMQVLPRFVSVDENNDEHEFLLDYFKDKYNAMSMVFLKGYQWPFDSKKVLDGSSVIDLLVYYECVIKKRRVYLDYSKNPFEIDNIEFEKLSPEAYNYLSNSKALFGTPIERLLKMNTPAVDLYKSKGVDLSKQYLEIKLCAQHHNGGISVDMWWQTSIKGMFAIGECAGTHGVTRPGGTALNAGQVGGLRAAQFISKHSNKIECDCTKICKASEQLYVNYVNPKGLSLQQVKDITFNSKRLMSDSSAAIRNIDLMQKALSETDTTLNYVKSSGINEKKYLSSFCRLLDILITQKTVLVAMIDYSKTYNGSRGSAIYYNKNGCLRKGLNEMFRFNLQQVDYSKIQEQYISGDNIVCCHRPVRAIPADNDIFEIVWNSYRENENIY